MEAHFRLPAELTSPGQARRVVAATLETWGHDDLAWVAVLLTSELVSNAVVHAHSASQVHLTANANSLQVTVSDSGDGVASVDLPEKMGETGRGLALVANLADDWGATRDNHGAKVWFRLTDRGARSAAPADP